MSDKKRTFFELTCFETGEPLLIQLEELKAATHLPAGGTSPDRTCVEYGSYGCSVVKESTRTIAEILRCLLSGERETTPPPSRNED